MALLLKNLVFTLLVPGTVAVALPWLISGGPSRGASGTLPLAALFFALGGAIYVWCVWDFATFGRGTPAPIDAPKKLVVRGLYRFTRNPMYVGVLSVILGWVVWIQSLQLVAYAAVVATCFHLFTVLYEEPHLQREFGQDYLAYKAAVSRWLPGGPRSLRG
ncbi:MAG: isoprenylcysteine carboxylmethyltransferase family protein [Myxococcota bacterium]|nr:isoprenylcysteine carboxylmethyltransferase family protein [Myxococcota bacterium]